MNLQVHFKMNKKMSGNRHNRNAKFHSSEYIVQAMHKRNSKQYHRKVYESTVAHQLPSLNFWPHAVATVITDFRDKRGQEWHISDFVDLLR